jgi:hypothetical protein
MCLISLGVRDIQKSRHRQYKIDNTVKIANVLEQIKTFKILSEYKTRTRRRLFFIFQFLIFDFRSSNDSFSYPS